MSPHVLITGASGFIGQAMTARLLARGYRVRAAARDVSKLPESPDLEPAVLPDLAQPHDWRPLLADITHVVHLAGIAHATSAIPESRYMAVNCEATRALAVAARELKLSRVVLMSSVRAQTGPGARGVLTENGPALPTDAYGRSKVAAEAALASELAESETDWAVLRPVLVYGPGVKGNLASLVRIARLPFPLPLRSLAGRRSVLHIDSLSDAVAHALSASSVSRRVFLVADAQPVTVPDIVTALRAKLGRSPGLFPLHPKLLATAAGVSGLSAVWERLNSDLVVDTSRLQATGWKPRQDCHTALAASLLHPISERHG